MRFGTDVGIQYERKVVYGFVLERLDSWKQDYGILLTAIGLEG
jgi:hypothetical protein